MFTKYYAIIQIQKRRAISLCESIISMAETNGRLEYCIWDSELKQTDVMEEGGGVYLLCWGTQACDISWVYFLPKNSGAECQFLRKILMHGNILLGNRPNFFVEHMTKSQNQPYRFKSGKNTFPWAKLLIT